MKNDLGNTDVNILPSNGKYFYPDDICIIEENCKQWWNLWYYTSQWLNIDSDNVTRFNRDVNSLKSHQTLRISADRSCASWKERAHW